LFSTHNLVEAQEMCDRVAILNRGIIVACDTPSRIPRAVSQQKTYRITFTEATLEGGLESAVKKIELIPGVQKTTLEIDANRNVSALSLSVDSNFALSSILPLLIWRERYSSGYPHY